jgi:hypothetical protein
MREEGRGASRCWSAGWDGGAAVFGKRRTKQERAGNHERQVSDVTIAEARVKRVSRQSREVYRALVRLAKPDDAGNRVVRLTYEDIAGVIEKSPSTARYHINVLSYHMWLEPTIIKSGLPNTYTLLKGDLEA